MRAQRKRPVPLRQGKYDDRLVPVVTGDKSVAATICFALGE